MTDTAGPGRPSRTWMAALVAAAVALALYAPTWAGAGHGFVNYDDPYLLSQDNPAIARGFAGWLELLSPFRRPPLMNQWLPAYYASIAIDHHVFGGAPWVYHLHSALLHAACAAAVVLIARRLGLGVVAAAAAGAAFAAHPAATENVAWVAGRKDPLSFLWMAFAAIAYLEGIARRRAALHWVGAACLAVSLASKGTTLVLPALLAVHATLLRGDGLSRRERWLPVAPYAAVALAMTSIHYLVARGEGTAGAGTGAGIGALLLADLEIAWRYTVLLILPVEQSVEWGIDPAAVDAGRAVLGATVLVGTVGAVLWTRRSRPAVAAVLLCVLLALAPFNNLFPRTSVLFAERYAHVALLPVAIAVGALVQAAGTQGLVGAAAFVAGLAVLTVRRVPVWHDAVTLWEDAAATAPASAFVRMQLAEARSSRAREAPDEAAEWNPAAEAAWREAAGLARDELSRMRAESGLGTHLLTTPPAGEKANTEERVREAVALLDSAERRLAGVDAPGSRAAQLASIRVNRAAAHELLGDADRAMADWQGAAQADERNAAAWTGLARLCFATGRGREASEALARSAALAPEDPVAARERSELRLAGGDAAGAKGELETVLAKRPDDYDLLIALARLDASFLRPVDAEKRFRRALKVRPGDAVARQGIAAALLDQAQAQAARDELDAARRAAEAAIEFAPESSAPHQVLGIVARRAGDLEEATARLRRARDLYPEGVRIREALASVLAERAVAAFDAHDGLAGDILAAEAADADAPAVATRRIRIERGVGGWPPADPAAGELARVTRDAALRGFVYLATGRAADALPELLVAERGSDGGAPALRRNVLLLLVRARFLVGRADEAVDAARALRDLPAGAGIDAWDGWSELASALAERALGRRAAGDAAGAAADITESHAALDEAGRRGMPAAKFHLRRGEIHFAEERYVDATREFDRASDADPVSPDPCLDRAAVFRSHYLLEEDKSYLTGAERDLRRAFAMAPSDPRVLAALGEILVLQAKPSEAYPWLQRALLADPSQQGVRRMLSELTIRAARTHLEKKELKEARDAADRALALDADAPGATVLLGDVLRAEGDWKQALAQYTGAEARWPTDPEPKQALARYHYDLGHAYLLKGRMREAAESFVRCKRIPQDKVDVSGADERLHGVAVTAFREALRLRDAKKLAESAEQFSLSVLAEPTREGWFNLGLVRGEAGDHAGAAEAFGGALALDENDTPSRLNRAGALFRLGRWDDAAADYRRAIAALPEGDPGRRAAERDLAWIEEQRRTDGDGPR